MDEYIVDERIGCVAVYLKSRADETNGCHADDDRNIFYAVGVLDSNGAWTVPQELVDQATVVCKESNERLKPQDAMKCEQFNPRPLELTAVKKIIAGNTAMSMAIALSFMLLLANGDSIMDFAWWVAKFFVIVFVILSLFSTALYFYRGVENNKK